VLLYFSASTALIPALFSVWHNVSGLALATVFTHLDDEEPIDSGTDCRHQLIPSSVRGPPKRSEPNAQSP